MAEQELARFVDRHTVEYIRFFPHPIERVWRAITDPAEISSWFWTAKFDLRLGGAYSFGGEDSAMKGVITAFDPPRMIRFNDPPAGEEGYFQFALESVEGGTRMVFIHHGTPGFVAEGWPWPGLLAGWHKALDNLANRLDGAPLDGREFTELYTAHVKANVAENKA